MDEPSLVGQTISHYRIVERLGGGGMGIVYKAVDTRLNRFVALKFLSANLTRDPDAKERFVQEAQSASALDHPNICTIHEIDETPDRELFLTLAYYEGETLKKRIERGALPIDEAVDIAFQIAQALSRAHGSGIIHRDIKPANVMLPKDGPVKIVDFGLAKLIGHSDLTKTGTTVGTVAYMAPEQIRGSEAGPAADVWAVGVVLYQMVSGRRPFDGKDDLVIVSAILDDTAKPIGALRPEVPDQLQRIIARALDKNVAHRYPSATELLADLAAYRAAQAPAGSSAAAISQFLRRPLVAASIAVVLLAASVPAVLAYRRASRARWARNEGIPQIMQLVAKDDFAGAFALATEVEQYLPGDPVLAKLWPQFSATGALTTDPSGADVSVQPYGETGDAWRPLGRTPITNIRLPREAFRFKIDKDGYATRQIASTNPGNVLSNIAGRGNATPITIPLSPKDRFPEMVRIPGGTFPVGLTVFGLENPERLEPFWIDRTEVTNRAFKRFVDAGGYGSPKYWDGASVEQFRDSTGRPGPATWELGGYPSGQVDYPVGGISWFEALAYCRSVGKTLPTLYHWSRAALSPVEIGNPLAPSIIPLSNFSGKGPAAVESYRGLGPYGTFDMAGNVREWIWNESTAGRRWNLGGSSSDPPYMFVMPTSVPPLDRSAANGVRCALYDDATPVPDRLLARVEGVRDNRTAKAVSDEVFAVFKRQLAYIKSPFDSRVEVKDESSPDSIKETLSFDAGYEDVRVRAYLALPRNAKPPYQLVVLFPGVGAFLGRASSETAFANSPNRDIVLRSGRAIVMPVFKGSFERWDPFLTAQGADYARTYRAHFVQWRQDLGRLLDVLTARSDIDATRIAYWGASFGASSGSPLVALEDRLKVAVLAPAGFTFRDLPPEADAINYVGHITVPTLMIGGRHDYVFPLETSQKPMFERLGTPADRKRHVVFDSGHANFPRSELIREVLGWLDKHLGPVQSSNP